jgi:SAM-dependent methyltransferase
MKAVLNVGGNSKYIGIPAHYKDWRHDLLDIDPRLKPDILCDGRELHSLPPETYDAVYCSHNLEHYFHHETYKVLQGFRHVLKAEGFAEIIVPHIPAVMKYMVGNSLDINDILYQSDAGPVTIRDVIYGYAPQIEKTGNSFYSHKTGFSPASLGDLAMECGFHSVLMKEKPEMFEIRAYAFKERPTEYLQELLEFKMQ